MPSRNRGGIPARGRGFGACRRRGGLSALWLPVMLVALLALAGLAVDWGWMRVAQTQLQTAADSAALAGVSKLPGQVAEARARAVDAAAQNYVARVPHELELNDANHDDGDIVIGRYSGDEFVATLSGPNAIKVVARRTQASPNGRLPLFLARALGVESIQTERDAIALVHGDAMVLLRPSGEGLHYSGDGSIDIGGVVHVNSPYVKGMSVSGNGAIRALGFDLSGKLYNSGSCKVEGEVRQDLPPVPDPLAHLPVPILSQHVVRSTSKLTPAAGRTLLPGRYRGGLELKANVTFSPGVYIVEGGGIKFGAGTVVLNNVVVYNTGTNDTTSNADQFAVSGNSAVIWTAPTSGPYAGIAYFQNRVVADKKVEISGNGLLSIQGTIYAKAAEIQLSGNGGTACAGLVAASMQVSGNGKFRIDTPTSWGDRRALLVE